MRLKRAKTLAGQARVEDALVHMVQAAGRIVARKKGAGYCVHDDREALGALQYALDVLEKEGATEPYRR